MLRTLRLMSGFCAAFVLVSLIPAAEPDLSGYRTVATAVAAKETKGTAPTTRRPAFLGLSLTLDANARLAVADVAAESPAAKAGVLPGDHLLMADGKPVASEDLFHELIRTKAPGKALKLNVSRKDKPMELTATLARLSRRCRRVGCAAASASR